LKVGEIAARIEKRIPLSWAEEWDNSGLSVGDPNREVNKIAVALDVSCETVGHAAAAGCQLLVTHHPAIFRPLNTVLYDVPAEKAVAAAIKHGLALYAAHTNWDVSPEGVNVCLAGALNLEDIMPLQKPTVRNGAWGLGAIGKLKSSLSVKECLELLIERWHLTDARAYGDLARKISKIALGGGACGDLWPLAKKVGADVFITSDVRYSERNDALSMDLNVINTDHGETERVWLMALESVVESVSGLEVETLEESGPRRIA